MDAAHQASEAEALASFLVAQQEKLANPTSVSAKQGSDDDEEDVDDSFRHLRIAGGGNKKGKVIRGERESGLEGEAKRAQAIRGKNLPPSISLAKRLIGG